MIVTSKDIYHLPFSVTASLTFANSQTVNIDSEDIDASGTGWSVNAGTSTLPIGAVVGRSFTLSLINDAGQWNGYDFFGCVIDITLDYGDGCTVTVKDLTVTEPPETLGTVITMTALDNAWRLDKPYTTALAYPASIGQVYREILSKCGIASQTSSHSIFSTSIQSAMSNQYSCRQVLSFIATAAGANMRITSQGKLEIVDITVPNAESTAGTYHDIDEVISLSSGLHDVEITGLSTKTENDSTGETGTITVGTDGYIIEIENNPIIKGRESATLAIILSKIGGMTLRKFDCSAYNYSIAEIFDPVAVENLAGEKLYGLLTGIEYSLGGGTTLTCNIDTPRSVGSSFDPALRALMQARQLIATERTAREQAVMDLQEALENAGGLYETTESDGSGGTIYYLHDHPTLAESTNVIKLTSEAIALSTDGGRTYPYGFILNGDVIARILSAEGINADWINAGALVVKDQSTGAVLFSADVAAGMVYIDGISVDDAVVTVGHGNALSNVKISPTGGVTIDDLGVGAIEINGHKVTIPTEMDITSGGYLRLGAYIVKPSYNRGFQVVYSPEF